jgi:hypothetical protein
MSKVLNVPIQYFFESLQEPDGGSGFGEAGAEHIIDVASSTEGVQLARVLAEMNNAGRRKLLVAIAKTIADAKEL